MEVDALRYFLLREVTFGQDGSCSSEAIVNGSTPTWPTASATSLRGLYLLSQEIATVSCHSAEKATRPTTRFSLWCRT